MVGFSRILCPVDFSECSQRALEFAVALGTWYGAPVTALHVVVDPPVVDAVGLYRDQPSVLGAADFDGLHQRFTEFVGTATRGADIATECIDGMDVRDEIARHAVLIGADLIVMGTHGRSGIEHVLLGSVAEAVGRRATCPVMLVPPRVAHAETAKVPFTRIVCAVDLLARSRGVVDLALELAQESDAHLTLVHALEVPPELHGGVRGPRIDVPALRAAAEAAALEQLRDLVPSDARTYCNVHADVRYGWPSHAILEAATERHADLIVIGARSHSALDRLVFGTTTHAVLRDAGCPVLAIHTPPARQQSAVA